MRRYGLNNLFSAHSLARTDSGQKSILKAHYVARALKRHESNLTVRKDFLALRNDFIAFRNDILAFRNDFLRFHNDFFENLELSLFSTKPFTNYEKDLVKRKYVMSISRKVKTKGEKHRTY